MSKLTFDEAIERLNEERSVKKTEVKARDLKRKIWVASNGFPGCLNDGSSIYTVKDDAIEHCLTTADDGEGYPKGMASWLRKEGDRAFQHNGYNYRVERMTLADVL